MRQADETTRLKNRLQELKLEFEQGQAALAALDRQRQELRDGLLRIAGAIQVLEELSVAAEPATPPAGLAREHEGEEQS